MRFKNKVCIVTGAGSGIGRATALRLASEGGIVAVLDRSETGGNETVAHINRQNDKAVFIKCDVGKEDEIMQAVDSVIQQFGKVDVLVNNAAMMTFKKITELTSEEWDM